MLASTFREPSHRRRGEVVMSADLEGRRFSGFKVLNRLRVLFPNSKIDILRHKAW